ncbi:MAG: hypothetical protein MUE96_04785 [Bacteroidia bacterium]|jgi:hypothetical protein|nr:hypothetical protein [Bacteroidia bacterium]
MNITFRFAFLVIPIALLQSCSSIYYGVVGIRNPKPITPQEINALAQKWGIPNGSSFILDTGCYKNTLRGIQSDAQKNNHAQPLQALYFTNSSYPVSFQINCYAGGFPNLKWNRNGNMDVFPPREQAPIDSAISLYDIKNCIQPANEKTYANASKPMVLVFWTKFMKRQTKRFLKEVNRNAQSRGQNQVNIIYINADNLFLE